LFFKNLVIYRLPAGWSLSPSEIEEKLSTRPLQPCAPFDMLSKGWVAPSKTGRLVHNIGRQCLLALGVEQKILPASVVRQEAQRRAQVLEQTRGFPVGRREMRDLKLKVTEELRARALCRQRVTRAWLDPENGWCVVDAASPNKAEELIEVLRDTLGSFAVTMLQTQHSAHASMAVWLTAGEAPGRFGIEQDLELASKDGVKASVRYARCPLESREIKTHLGAGRQPVRLGLSWHDRIAFVLTDKLQLKRIEFLEMGKDADDSSEAEGDEAERFDADFTVMAGELAKLLQDVVEVLGGETQQAQAA
jgi:recombination associated protein RdgC